MGKKFKVKSLSQNEFKFLISMIRIFQSNRFIWLSSEEQVRNLVGFIEYRAQHALYEIVLEWNPTVCWEDFVLFVRSNEKIRQEIEAVATQTVIQFNTDRLDFNLPEDGLEYFENDVDDDGGEHWVTGSKIFDESAGYVLLTFFLMMSEKEYFKRLHKADPQYSWSMYRWELENNKELWKQFCRTFQYGLRQMDFMAEWYARDIPEILLLHYPNG